METLEFFVILIAMMLWLFCTSHLFMCICGDEDESLLSKLGIFVFAMVIGWIVVPIKLGMDLYEKL